MAIHGPLFLCTWSVIVVGFIRALSESVQVTPTVAVANAVVILSPYTTKTVVVALS